MPLRRRSLCAVCSGGAICPALAAHLCTSILLHGGHLLSRGLKRLSAPLVELGTVGHGPLSLSRLVVLRIARAHSLHRFVPVVEQGELLLCSYPLDRLAAAVTCLAQAQVAARRQLCDRLSRPCLQVAILLPAQNLPGTSLHYRCALRMFGRLASGRPRISHDWHKLEKKEERKVK